MNNRSAQPPARRIARLPAPARHLRHQVTTWALAHGLPVDYDALTVILGAKSELPTPLRRWTEDDVWRLWWLDLSLWCGRYGLDPPAGLAQTLRTLFAHLDAETGFTSTSDSVAQLNEALEAAGVADLESTSQRARA